jgi:hypothetical protein
MINKYLQSTAHKTKDREPFLFLNKTRKIYWSEQSFTGLEPEDQQLLIVRTVVLLF